MAEKEIKTFLKDAREYIKVKEYKNALREIKKVLNKDKNNYMGLVFCGLCLSELDQPAQALQVSIILFMFWLFSGLQVEYLKILF